MTDNITLSDETRTARKQYLCDQCLQPVVPGQKYRRLRGIWEGTPSIFRSHAECEDAAAQMRDYHDLLPDEGVPLLHTDTQPEDHEWIVDEFPVVASRLGIVLPRAGEP